MQKAQKLEIAKDILEHCYWGNTAFTPQDIINCCQDKKTAKMIFSAIFQNSRCMYEHLKLVRKEWIIEFIQEQQIPSIKCKYFKKRKDLLIAFFIDPNHKVEGLEWK